MLAFNSNLWITYAQTNIKQQQSDNLSTWSYALMQINIPLPPLLCNKLIYIDTHAFTNKPILNMWLTQRNIQIHRDLQHNPIMFH